MTLQRVEEWEVAPVLIVRNLAIALAYYSEQLGFKVLGSFGEPMESAFVGRGGIQLMLHDAAGKPTPGSNRNYKDVAWDAHVWVDDVDALHSDLVARGAQILKSPAIAFHGNKELEVADLDGHVFCFGQLAGVR